ncbi:putative dioxygenase [Altererythrobacter epoxidivorans]|uniref:Putative dioxygenase n=1 Tax=Altererythrobacter epoxidivorans TaxID=361183 RepID=A0A0M3TAB6_9SPHN|nr:TauD/TfdA family dioxygenase [Altererythrobacter epoxidivorans]ALE16496.1 putative dioxygenase [Altererythrobacter epoxidivorans]
MALQVETPDATCGARVTGIDLAAPLAPGAVQEIRAAWLRHRVVAFPAQRMDDDALERFTIAMGGFGEDPFFAAIPGRDHIAAILREANETTPLFAESWHSDWSFLGEPPAGTCLLAIDIPPTGGDTLFADQIAAFAALPDDRKDHLRSLTAIHSAKHAYAPEGAYGERDKGRSMAIRPDESARETRTHPLVTQHPETAEEAIFSTLGYIVGIERMEDEEAYAFLSELAKWQTQEQFVYRHRWEPDMLVMWDNRSVLHKATGGYEGHRRELHRTTIAAYRG